MKAYLFFEWPYAGMGPEVESKPCHDIEIPDGTIGMIPLWQYCDGESVGHKNWVPIPRSKKVKKWIYEFVYKGITWRSACPISEAEYASQPMTGHKMPETMIEVEE